MKIVTAAEMREIDRVPSQQFGVPSLILMENVGTAVAEFAMATYPVAKTFGVICGKGDNGGDGFVIARKLHEAGREVRLLLLGDRNELRGDAATNFTRLPLTSSKSAPPFALIEKAEERSPGQGVFACDVLIDAILGTGFRPPVSGSYADAIARINSSTAPVIAVDIPSGADADVMGEQTGA